MATTITANDEPTEIEADVDKRFSSIVVNLPVRQTGTGTPSPSNPRPFTMWTDVSLYVSDTEEADEPTLSIELPTPLYGGKIDMVRGEIATTYNSKESGTGWEMTQEGQFRCQVSAYNNGDETSTNVADLYAVHYETVSNKDAYDATDDLTCGLATIAGTTYLYVNDAQYTTLESFATHIADEVFVFRAHIPMSDVTEPHIVYLPAGTSYVWADAGFVDLTVSGTPPLSLPNSLGKPLKAWSVDVLPKQDLHGYESPWPAGGGKNKLPDEANSITAIGCTFSYSNGVATLIGTAVGNGGRNDFRTPYFSLKAGTYYLRLFDVVGDTKGIFVQTGASIIAFGTSVSFTLEEDKTDVNIGVNVSSGETYNYSAKWGVFTAKATSYSPYSNLCPIYGTDKLTITTAGKNLYNPENFTISTVYMLLFGSRATSDISTHGMPVMGGVTYTVSIQIPDVQNAGWGVYGYFEYSTSLITFVSNTQTNTKVFTFTPAEDSKLMFWAYLSGSNTWENLGVTTDNVKMQIEFGSTATPYTPYLAPSQTVLTLPQTVYAGTIGNATGDSRSTIVDMGAQDWIYHSGFGVFYYVTPDGKPTGTGQGGYGMCEAYDVIEGTYYSNLTDGQIAVGTNFFSITTATVVVKDSRFTDAAQFKAAVSGIKLIYELNTPATFAVPSAPIPTPTGTATAWATADDGTVDGMEVTYVGKA